MAETSRAIPLPDALAGVPVTRTVTIDSALLFILDGALSALVDLQHYKPTGTLTEEDVLAVLETMLEDYYSQP